MNKTEARETRGAEAAAEAETAKIRPLSRRERTENALLDAATEVFLARGYDGATTGEIARVAGVAAGTFYLYFDDKRAAFVAVSSRAAHDILTQMREVLEPGVDVARLVRITLELVADYWRAHPALTRLILSGGPALGMADEDDGAFVDEVRQTIEDVGELRGDEAMGLALYLVGLSQQLGHLIVARPKARATAEALITLAADRL